MSFMSYAQNQEDVLLHRVFGGQETGFYVDVGAYDPVNGSVTKAFYDRGWSGINVEPGAIFDKLAAARPRDVNLRMAVLDRTGEVAFLQNATDAGMSRVLDHPQGGQTQSETAAVVTQPPPGEPAYIKVACDMLENIVAEHSQGRPVDFLKIDAEGAETAIIRATDWRRLRPRVVLVEATLPWSSTLSLQDWEPILLEQGYRRVYFDGINCFYAPEEELPALGRFFQTPVNVLDRARPYDAAAEAVAAENAGLKSRLAALEAELDQERGRLIAELAGLRQEAISVLAERDATHRDFETTSRGLEEMRLHRDRLQHQLNALVSERDRLTADLSAVRKDGDATVTDLRHARAAHAGAVESVAEHGRYITRLEQDIAAMAAQRNRLLAQVQVPIAHARPSQDVPVVAGSAAGPPAGTGRFRRPMAKAILRRSALLAYGLVRPVVRPAAWRLRSFIIGPLLPLGNIQTPLDAGKIALRAEVDRLGEQVCQLARLQEAARADGGRWLQEATRADGGGLTELRQLANKIEAAIITLATTPAGEPAAPLEPAAPVPLLLPDGRKIEVDSIPGDISVSAVLVAAGGLWEPHVQLFLANTIKPDWVCADIGANIGVHTLCLATLAHQGTIYAFEADPANYAVLSRNARSLPPPVAEIEAVHVALWDRAGVLITGGADELAGCSFVSDGEIGASETERRLRSVVSREGLAGIELHVRVTEIDASPLDDWAAEMPRLDFIKLDVEGAEAWVVRGADRTIWRHQPVLLVEYNPMCAAAYFGQPEDALYHELQCRFDSIHALETNGTMTLLPDWESLQARLRSGKGWEDLVCLPAAS